MNQLMKNNKRNFLDRIMSRYYRYKLGITDKTVIFDTTVYLMRYPKNIFIDSGAYIKNGARLCPCNDTAQIHIGNKTTIGYNTLIFASGNITIGNDCMIAPNVYLVDSDHGTQVGERMNRQPNIVGLITVENDVWIGTGSVILKDSHITEGCVIAANSVVKGTLEPFSIYGGAPAKKIGIRK